MAMLSHNVAEEYATLFSLSSRSQTEEPWQFRLRIARTLEQMGEIMRAHEALWNERMNGDPSVEGSLSRGYDETFIIETARYVESAYQEQRQK
jgi:hypothetical protein